MRLQEPPFTDQLLPVLALAIFDVISYGIFSINLFSHLGLNRGICRTNEINNEKQRKREKECVFFGESGRKRARKRKG